MTMKRYITLLPALLIAASAVAQTATNDTINRMVLVESTYNPIISGATKHQFIPGEVEPSIKKSDIVYAQEGIPITQFDRRALPATSQPITTAKGLPGYLHLGYGNYNNTDVLATYNLHFGQRHALSFSTALQGWNGKLPTPSNDNKWSSYLYQATANATYRLTLDAVELGAALTPASPPHPWWCRCRRSRSPAYRSRPARSRPGKHKEPSTLRLPFSF